MRGFVIALLMSVAGCSSSSPESFTCAIGQLQGTWRVTYVQTNGDCGMIPDETVVLTPSATSQAGAGCTYAANQVSADKCRIDLDYTCPLSSGIAGTQHWVGVTRQTGAGTLSSSMTLTLATPNTADDCRSTYDQEWTQQ